MLLVLFIVVVVVILDIVVIVISTVVIITNACWPGSALCVACISWLVQLQDVPTVACICNKHARFNSDLSDCPLIHLAIFLTVSV